MTVDFEELQSMFFQTQKIGGNLRRLLEAPTPGNRELIDAWESAKDLARRLRDAVEAVSGA